MFERKEEPVSAARSERLMNLLITLLVTRQPITKERLRDVIEGYRGSSEEAFEKMFERDKEELRSLGIPIDVAYLDKFFEDEMGYQVDRGALELPPIDLNAEEAAVVGLAARVWQHAGLAEATSSAVLKLKAGGAEVDRAALDIVQPEVSADEPSFDALWEATSTRTPVSFDYHRAASPATRRHLEPWGMVTARGRWYVAGFDTDRGEPRLFRLSRILGEVTVIGDAGSYEVPPGTDVRALATALAPPRETHTATLKVRADRALGLRRRAQTLESIDESWDLLSVEYADRDSFAGEILSYLDAVVVLEPASLRAQVRERLASLVSAS